MLMRQAVPQDRECLVDLFIQLNQESSFLAFEPGECEAQRKSLQAMFEANIRQEHSLVVLAEVQGKPIGVLMATGSLMKRRRGCVHVVIGVLERFTGKGVGKRLMASLFDWAKKRRLRRVELTVMTHNERAVALYRKCGFEVEGVKRDSLKLEDRFVDEYYMARLLPAGESGDALSPLP